MPERKYTFEVHGRPMLLPHVSGVPVEENRFEVDLWLRMPDGTALVLLELVADDRNAADLLMARLVDAGRRIEGVREIEGRTA